MALILKQSTAVDVLIGPFLDLTDGATAETGESPSVKLSKNGQTLAAKNDATTPVHDADGYYNCELDATDTNTVGTLVLTVAKSANALPVRHEFQVVEEEVYDDQFGASAVGYLKPVTAGRDLAVDASNRVDVGSVAGTAQTGGDLMASLGEENAAAAAGDPSTTESVMQYVKQLVNVLVGTAGVGTFPAAAAPANAVSLAEVIRAIYDDTNSLDGTKVPDTLSLANINAEVDTALVDIGLDHLISAAVAGADVADNSIVAQIVASAATADWDTFDNTTDSLEAIRDRGDAAWTTGGGSADPALLQNTTIATLSSQTSFTLTDGSADDDAYNGAFIVVTDSATSTQKAVGLISDYTGSTKTVTLAEDPAIFTMAAGDTVDIVAVPKQLPDAVHAANGGLPTVDANNRVAGMQGTKNTLDDLNDLSAAQVNAEVDTALADINLDHLLAAAVVGTDVVDDSVIAKLVSSAATADWDTFVNTTDALQAVRDHIGDGTNLTEAGGTGDHLTAVGLATGAISSTTFAAGAIDAAAIAADAIGSSELNANVIDDIWEGSTLTEAYAADGAAATPAQLLYMIWSALTEFAISGTTISSKKLDGTTEAMTWTLDDGTDPTSRTRAT